MFACVGSDGKKTSRNHTINNVFLSYVRNIFNAALILDSVTKKIMENVQAIICTR